MRDPVVIVEVLSPGTHKVDTSLKLTDYFRLPSLCHYLIVTTRRRVVIHHYRDTEGGTGHRIVAAGILDLEPPGIAVVVADLLGNE